tara:strand:- start:4191 stop:4874 length:684 start_codon:yes stop_codon:yes gene_type:complete
MGNTPWAKIKILRGFLEGRERAVGLEEVAHLTHNALLAELAYLKTTGAPEHEQMRLQAKILESESNMMIVDEAYELNRKEIDILNKLLAECYVIAEPTRIEGYSDEEMFEANEANEFTVRTLREMQSEIISQGRPTPSTILHAMDNPVTLTASIQAGLLPIEAIPLLTSNPPLFAVEEMAALNTLREEKLMLVDTEEQTIVDAPEEEEVVEEEAEEADDDGDGEDDE